jgi:hypothetical protein
VCVKVEKERLNVRRVAAFGVGCQLMHQFSDDASLIHHLLLGVCKKQGGGEGKSDIIRFFWAKDRH